MIYSTGGVDRYVKNQEEIVTIPIKDVSIIPNTNQTNSKNKKVLKRMVTFRSMKLVEGDNDNNSDDDDDDDSDNDSLSFCTSNNDPFQHSPIKKTYKEIQDLIKQSESTTKPRNSFKRLSINTPSPYKFESLKDGSTLIRYNREIVKRQETQREEERIEREERDDRERRKQELFEYRQMLNKKRYYFILLLLYYTFD